MAQKNNRSKDQLPLRILLCNEASPKGVVWIAQCLDWDLAGQSDSPTTALQAFEQILWAQVVRDVEKKRPVLKTKEPAPDDIQEQFRTGWAFREPYFLHPPASVRVLHLVEDTPEIRLAALAA